MSEHEHSGGSEVSILCIYSTLGNITILNLVCLTLYIDVRGGGEGGEAVTSKKSNKCNMLFNFAAELWQN